MKKGYYVITSTMTEMKTGKQCIVYMKERILEGKGGGIYAQWTKDITGAKLFRTVDDAMSYDKSRMGHSLDSHAYKGESVSPDLSVAQLCLSLYHIDKISISERYRRPVDMGGMS